jgi:hypothetical protein
LGHAHAIIIIMTNYRPRPRMNWFRAHKNHEQRYLPFLSLLGSMQAAVL